MAPIMSRPSIAPSLWPFSQSLHLVGLSRGRGTQATALIGGGGSRLRALRGSRLRDKISAL